jgi:hypothetical protein
MMVPVNDDGSCERCIFKKGLNRYLVLDKLNQTGLILETDKMHSELRILDWILSRV